MQERLQMPKIKDDYVSDIVESWDEWNEGEYVDGKQPCPYCESVTYGSFIINGYGDIEACSECKENNEQH